MWLLASLVAKMIGAMFTLLGQLMKLMLLPFTAMGRSGRNRHRHVRHQPVRRQVVRYQPVVLPQIQAPVRPVVAYRFNPPPCWPPVPYGFRPLPGWQPDPWWPPVPPGWPLWVPDR